ncbi:MAG TPA: AbrB/MazE/SpoVT family DNA-binding domain-containing protein [Candidatus Nanoarchaeia archaeon]|nr:AbrB/MazE/SpoVT family DNA-binding domain-containing protein [Candidatus Nanoarchaeia archaeon]
METESIARKWGNSIGFIIPAEVAEKENIRPNSKVRFEIIRVDDISDTFGTLPRKMSGQKFKDLARAGW